MGSQSEPGDGSGYWQASRTRGGGEEEARYSLEGDGSGYWAACRNMHTEGGEEEAKQCKYSPEADGSGLHQQVDRC